MQALRNENTATAQLPRSGHRKIGRPASIQIDGREYVDSETYMMRYGYNINTLQYARAAGLPFKKIGGKLYYNEKDCQQWHAGA
ncbi:MAG: hypothetical protein FWB91_07965 [Defluviitaleaceae bacterium]|nr:hypothetical protein [Defluviitaleaceae bacterium]